MNFLLLIHVFLPTIYYVVRSESGSIMMSDLFDVIFKLNTIMDEQNEIKKVLDRPTPLFSTMLDYDTTVTFANKETVKFGVVEPNVNGCYNNNTGLFKAPVSGTYYFSLTISQTKEYGANAVDIVAGDDKEILGYIYNSPSNVFEPRTVYALAQLDADEDVWIRCEEINCTFAPPGISSFAGFLVQEL